jgi:hypothetical protein
MRQEEIMTPKEQEANRESLRKFLKDKSGQQVKVCGMWTGDFIGVVTGVGWTQASFRVQASNNTSIKDGDVVTFPYGQYLKVVEV